MRINLLPYSRVLGSQIKKLQDLCIETWGSIVDATLEVMTLAPCHIGSTYFLVLHREPIIKSQTCRRKAVIKPLQSDRQSHAIELQCTGPGVESSYCRSPNPTCSRPPQATVQQHLLRQYLAPAPHVLVHECSLSRAPQS